MQNTTSFIKRVAAVCGLALGAFALSAVAANWAPPVSTPPTCLDGNPGCDAPINVSATGQGKVGKLAIGQSAAPATAMLEVVGGTGILTNSVITNALTVVANAGVGKVLKSDASGNATWQPALSGATLQSQFLNCATLGGAEDCVPVGTPDTCFMTALIKFAGTGSCSLSRNATTGAYNLHVSGGGNPVTCQAACLTQ